MPQSALTQGAAAQGLALARELARRAQRLEAPDAEPRLMPEAGVFMVADQLAVAGHDLAEILRRTSGGADQAAEALRLVTETARGIGPGTR
ncbi:hypothetical protein [Streptomyces palmae]